MASRRPSPAPVLPHHSLHQTDMRIAVLLQRSAAPSSARARRGGERHSFAPNDNRGHDRGRGPFARPCAALVRRVPRYGGVGEFVACMMCNTMDSATRMCVAPDVQRGMAQYDESGLKAPNGSSVRLGRSKGGTLLAPIRRRQTVEQSTSRRASPPARSRRALSARSHAAAAAPRPPPASASPSTGKAPTGCRTGPCCVLAGSGQPISAYVYADQDWSMHHSWRGMSLEQAHILIDDLPFKLADLKVPRTNPPTTIRAMRAIPPPF